MKIKIAVLVASLLLPIGLMILINRSNRPKEERYKQIARPLIALLFAFVCCVFLFRIDSLIDRFLNLSFMEWMKKWINQGDGVVYGIRLVLAYLTNVALLIAYLLFKTGYRAFFGLTFKVIHIFKAWIKPKKKPAKTEIGLAPEEVGNGRPEKVSQKKPGWRETLPDKIDALPFRQRVYWRTLDLFYDITGHTGTVRSSWLVIGKVFRLSSYLMLAFYLVMIAIPQLHYITGIRLLPYDEVNRWLEKSYLWPAISLVVVFEISHFLDGWEKVYKEEEVKPIAPPESGKKHADYSGHQDAFIEAFPDRYAGALKIPPLGALSEGSDGETGTSSGGAQPESEDTAGDPLAKRIRERYQEMQASAGRSAGETVLDCVMSLSDRRNAVIDAPMSREFITCLMLYFNVVLSRGENLLVLCVDEETCQHVSDLIQDALGEINQLAQVWMIHTPQNAAQNEDCDILIVTPHMVLDSQVRTAGERLFSQLSTVLLVDTTTLIAGTGALLSVVGNSLALGSKTELQYIGLCNGVTAELRIALEGYFSPGRQFRPYQCYTRDESTRIMLWNHEPARDTDDDKAADPDRSRGDHAYLDLAIPMAMTAIKEGAASVSVVSPHIPSDQLHDSLSISKPYLERYMGGSFSQADLARIHFNRIDSGDPYAIVVDNSFCLPMTIRDYCRYIGDDCAMVHIISKPYMLRDYFAANAAKCFLNGDMAKVFSPVPGESDKTLAINLISAMADKDGLAEDRLCDTVASVKGQVMSLREALEACYSIAFDGENCPSIEDCFRIRSCSEFDAKSNQFVRKRRIYLKHADLLTRLTGSMVPARALLHGETVTLGFEKENIYRYCLPNQVIVLRGRMYHIDAIDMAEGLIRAGREVEALDEVLDYAQHRLYTIPELQPSIRSAFQVSRDISAMGDDQIASRYEAELLHGVSVSVETMGYMAPYPSQSALDLVSRYPYLELPESIRKEARRDLQNASVLALRFSGIAGDEAADRISITMAVLFSELMKTMFPHNYPCIAVCPVLHGEVPADGAGVSFADLSKLYPQVSCEGILAAPPETAEILIIEDSAHDAGVLSALYRNRQHPLSSVFSLLADYLKWRGMYKPDGSTRISPDYLKFGADEFPSCLDLQKTEYLLTQLDPSHTGSRTWSGSWADQDYCYFCRKDLRLSDYRVLLDEHGRRDRKVCLDCCRRLLYKQEDLIPLVNEARQYLCDRYNIPLPKKINARFVSASKMSKIVNRTRKFERAIGLYESVFKRVSVEIYSPKEVVLSTLSHEITHLWQHLNLGLRMTLNDIEGHAVYVEIRYIRDSGDTDRADRMDAGRRQETNEYGVGYIAVYDAVESRPDRNPYEYMLEKYKNQKNKNGEERQENPQE